MPVNQVKRNGSYAPLSAYYYDDDAVIRAGEKAEVLFTRSLAFSARQLKNGFISDAQVSRLGVGMAGLSSRVTRLVEVGLWQRVEDSEEGSGYLVCKWLKWNASADEIATKQRRDSDRKRGESA